MDPAYNFTLEHPASPAYAQDTGLVGCTDPVPTTLPTSQCQLPGTLTITPATLAVGGEVVCSQVMLGSFWTYAAGLPATTYSVLTLPYTQSRQPGMVQADATFTNAHGCRCSGSSYAQQLVVSADLRDMHCTGAAHQGLGRSAWVTLVVVAAIVPLLMAGLVAYLISRYEALLVGLYTWGGRHRSLAHDVFGKRSSITRTVCHKPSRQ
jgi:hypothetical protein